MTNKQIELINKGYNKDDVLRVSEFNESDLALAINTALDILSKDVSSVDIPKCIYVGGQPGVGKSVLSDRLKRSMNAVELSMDACRMFHPRYLEIEKLINNFYKDKNVTNSNNPGNDIATFTHDFSAAMINELIRICSDKKYNIILEWNMRHSSDVLDCMDTLKNKGYSNEAIVVATNKDTSLEACKLRADAMNSHGHIVRRVSDSFHKLCIDTIPSSVNEIYKLGTNSIILDKMNVVLRNGTIKWSSKNSLGLPGDKLNELYEDKSLDDINIKEYGDLSYRNESLGLNKKIIKLEDLKQALLEYKEISKGKVVNL